MLHNYDLHGVVKVRVQGDSASCVRHVDRRLGRFKVGRMDSAPDVDVFIEKAAEGYPRWTSVARTYHVERSRVCWAEHSVPGSERVVLEGLETGLLRVSLKTPRVPEQVFAHQILEPLVHYQLTRRGALLLHASAVGDGQNAYVFSGVSGTGKTSFMLYLLRAGMREFLADEFAILCGGGYVYSYPTPLSIFRHNLAASPFLVEALSRQHLLKIKIKSLVCRLSRGMLRPGEFMDVEELFPAVALPNQRPLAAIFYLSPVPAERIVIRPVDRPMEIEHGLISVLSGSFRFLSEPLEAYLHRYPTSALAVSGATCQAALRAIVGRVPCFEINLPVRFRFDEGALRGEFAKIASVHLL